MELFIGVKLPWVNIIDLHIVQPLKEVIPLFLLRFLHLLLFIPQLWESFVKFI